MPVEAKPLFRPDVLRPHLTQFQPPQRVEQSREKLAYWAQLLSSGKADTYKEQELLPEFLTDFFGSLLGYVGPAQGGDRYTISREKLVQAGGKFADAVLGEFTAEHEKYAVALEGKGPKDPLDRPYGGRRMSAVEQAYQYATNLPCDWIVATSIRQTRLYYKGADQYTFERFDTERLASDDSLLRKFVFLLGAERVIPPSGRCHLYDLLAASEKVGRELTKEFYVRYADMRQDAFEHLCQANLDVGRHEVLASAQKLLDRVLFVAFCEDRGLLPSDSIRKAYEHRDPYHPRPVWENFRGLFRFINQGNPKLDIPEYNGGLFADDPVLDQLIVPDAVCAYFRDLGAYDYRPAAAVASGDAEMDGERRLIDVDILGHIFEQSITDLERLRSELEGLIPPVGPERHKSRRKKEGAFYTPAFITRYIVQQALGGVLADRFEQLRQKHAEVAKGTAIAALADPRVYDLNALKRPQREALIQFWEAWQDELESIRLLDPACGSGAFLIQAFDQLYSAYQAANDRLGELRKKQRSLFDLDRRILQTNLYGVDLNEEAIEICKLSLWIKTAARGKVLTSLDHTIRVGNSVVADPAIDPKAFNWEEAFPEVTAAGGFDVVVGNPPYVRQELLTPIKRYLEQHFQAFHGMADLYVYFFETGARLLRPGGRLSFVVTNKWMRAGYAEPLRQFFSERTWIESVVDFGHAKEIFTEADVFPSIIVIRCPSAEAEPSLARACAIPRDQLRIDDLSEQIRAAGFEIPREQLAADPWALEPPAAADLLEKLRSRGTPLLQLTGGKPLRGIMTGLNDAYLVNTATRDALISANAGCADLLRPYLRGQDVKRWHADWTGLWMIAMRSSSDHSWPWAESGDQAESVFAAIFPSIHAHLKSFQSALMRRTDQGRFWWELRSCAYWSRFDGPKLMYQDITWRAQFCFDAGGTLSNNTVYMVPTADLWPLAVLNSPVAWWYSWRCAVHGKDEALRFFTAFVEGFPIPRPSPEQRETAETICPRLIEMAIRQQQSQRALLDWLNVEHDIEKPSQRLQAAAELDGDAFVAEVKKGRGRKNPLTASGLRSLRDEYARTVVPAQALAVEATLLEQRLAECVNAAYGLTPDEIDLMWRTAPPRMPISAPERSL